MSENIDETPFHFDPETAHVLGREPAGRGRLGHQVPMEATPNRVQEIEDAAVDAEPAQQELQELPRGHATDGVTIFVPPKPGILIGQLMLDAKGQALPINVVDPLGRPWQDGESNRLVMAEVRAFLAGHGDWMELKNPVDGHTFQLSRRALGLVLFCATARLEIKEPPVPDQTPGGIPITRTIEMTPALRRAMGM